MSLRLIQYYDKLATHSDWNAGDWADEDIMRELFADFTSVYDVNGKSILDAGCGVGEFYQYLKEQRFAPSEMGFIDLVPSLIDNLNVNHPEAAERGWHVEAVNFFDFTPPKRYDAVTMFGLAPCINHQFDDKIAGLKRLVELGLSACTDALYINFLSAQFEDIEPMDDDFYITFHPREVVDVLYNVHYTLYMHGFSFFSVLIRKEPFFDAKEVKDRSRLLMYA